MKIFTATEVARLLGVPFYRLYYLELTEQVSPAQRTASGRRYYTDENVEMLKEQLKKIKKSKQS